ncbi:MAG: START domain-containing protein [Bacteroidota bacterium]
MLFPLVLPAQAWDFVKEKEGIKIYTRTEDGKSLKSYKGVTDIKAPAEKVFDLIEDVNNTDWWDKNFKEIKVLLYEKYKRAEYYLVYDLPWPVNDRDLCVDVTVTRDSGTGGGRITSFPLKGVVPEREDLIRIKEHLQTWTVEPAGKNMSHVVLEGYLDPAGTIPDWVSNMLIVDSPVQVMTAIRQRLEK